MQTNSVPTAPARIIHGVAAHVVYARWVSHLLMRAAGNTNPVPAFRMLRHLEAYRRTVYGTPSIPRYVKAQGRYFWSLIVPGYPSRAYDRYIRGEIARAAGLDDQWLHFAIMAITRRCSLRCAHCFESDTLASADSLTSDDLQEILARLRRHRISQLQLSGGEPLMRLEDALTLVSTASFDTDIWFLTSGFGLTQETAMRLRQAGCTGVNIGLDDWDEHRHDDFRGREGAFSAAVRAAQVCHAAGLVVALTLCATREFVIAENLVRYLELARELHAGFVQILEPRPVGRFHGADVVLRDEQLRMLEGFFLSRNTEHRYREYPILFYPGYHQRTLGCFGAGNRYLYVDPTGEVHPCPFCRGSAGNILREPLQDLIGKLRARGCPLYHSRSLVDEDRFSTRRSGTRV